MHRQARFRYFLHRSYREGSHPDASFLGILLLRARLFCWKIENQESSQNTTELERITEEFNKKSNSLYTTLRRSRLAGCWRAPFLRRFLLCLNFNSFFEATTRVVLNVVRPRP
ncbi:hypothetical protein SLE2022_243310 [Rubroshorea leprosula]